MPFTKTNSEICQMSDWTIPRLCHLHRLSYVPKVFPCHTPEAFSVILRRLDHYWR